MTYSDKLSFDNFKALHKCQVWKQLEGFTVHSMIASQCQKQYVTHACMQAKSG